MHELKLIPVGDEIGIVLPRELLASLGAQEGDSLEAVVTPRGLLLTAGSEIHARHMEISRRVMRDKRNILRRLADS